MNIYLAFPLVFMLHELEEIAFMPTWLIKLKAQRNNRFLHLIPNSSPRAFTLMVLEEYCLLLIIMLLCWYTQALNFYFTLMLAYNLHILVHIIQAVLLRSYIPGLILGIFSFILIGWILWHNCQQVNLIAVGLFLPLNIIIIAGNLLLIHKLFNHS
ncbi:HXXEE domain-containing protein [Liquorilactobacillus capillatus]|uniref:HXXEE domain-containing protein n=1 Tax=Liquorilactobacillus capillatus DSM 19910 TaxID=1423731 RepID=A0A0R1M3R8_9LACO|nr:HXXEE domain-containing protein [Liquorilactobacillus capillatus]KRL02393.1 hypothetical protein FC81_GL000737 [Liquorilactobacillus capillatus DSM 19910]